MTGDILDAHFNINNTCNYLHFALQSGSNTMLKKMNLIKPSEYGDA